MSTTTLPELRQKLHRLAELSNEERETAGVVAQELRATRPDELIEGLGGHGLAAVYRGGEPGPRVLLRSDMDALPIEDVADLEYRSKRPGVAHKCGHDGHMAILIGVARAFGRTRPARGETVLLFQPAEETGEGAARVLDDERFEPLQPDRALALHNLPRFPMGRVVVREGPFASASTGILVDLEGVSSHAAEPHRGISPVAAICALAQGFQAAPQRAAALHECVQATVVGLDVGGPAFGTSPARGRLMATLRAHEQASMDALVRYCEDLARGQAAAYGLRCEIAFTDVFPATENDPEVVRAVARGAEAAGLTVDRVPLPFPWSEDFGHVTRRFPGALIGLGSGETQPSLHHRDYDFPDELIETGRELLLAAHRALLDDGSAPSPA